MGLGFMGQWDNGFVRKFICSPRPFLFQDLGGIFQKNFDELVTPYRLRDSSEGVGGHNPSLT